MSNFRLHKREAEELLSAVTDRTPPLCIRALRIIIELCDAGLKLEAENADLRLKVEELGTLCNRKARQCCHKDKIISSLDLELAALKRELAGEMEKY